MKTALEKTHFKLDRKKFTELLLYVARKSQKDPTFGATKLNKLLFFCDFQAYLQLGKPITGAGYQKLDHGPVPRPLPKIREELENKQDVIVVQEKYFNHPQKRLFALRDPDLSEFSGAEIAIVDEMIDLFRELEGTGIGDFSYFSIGYQMVGYGETIPYEAAFISPPFPLDEGEIRRAHELAKKHGWK